MTTIQTEFSLNDIGLASCPRGGDHHYWQRWRGTPGNCRFGEPLGYGHRECELRAFRASEFTIDRFGAGRRRADHEVGPGNGSFPTRRQVCVGDIALDIVDPVLGQTLLLRTCEAKVASNAAVGDAGVA